MVKPGIGRPLIDSLNQAYEAADGPVKEIIGYMRDTVQTNLNAFRKY